MKANQREHAMHFSAAASSFARQPPVTVEPTTTVREASRIMDEHDIGALVVVEGHHVMGVLSERDISHAVSMSADLDEERVASWMTSPAVTARPTDPILDVAFLMLDSGIRHVPLVDEHGTVSGMVSLRDIERPLLVDALAPATPRLPYMSPD
jgi:CBS domain-containing protein